jgi:hypothetical protein
MRSMSNSRRFTELMLVLLLAGGVSLSHVARAGSSAKDQGDPPLRRATFEVRHELQVMIPEGAQRVRIWFAFPQDDLTPGDGAGPAQQLSDLQVDAPYAYRIERDSEESKMLYLEAKSPREKELKIVETFVLTRTEVRSGVDPTKARPLSDADRARFAPYDVAVADLYAGEFKVTADNEVLMRRTTADGTFGADPAKVEYYFGNLDERRMVWSIGRDLILSPKQDAEAVNALPKAYVEIDGKVHPEGTGWVRDKEDDCGASRGSTSPALVALRNDPMPVPPLPMSPTVPVGTWDLWAINISIYMEIFQGLR